MSNRIITLDVSGEIITASSHIAGAAGSHNAVSFAISFDGAWDGLSTKKLYFADANGENPVFILLDATMLNSDGAYIVPIPSEPLAVAGEMTLNIRGVYIASGCTSAERIMMAAHSRFTVLPAEAPSNDMPPTEPSITQVEQIMANVAKVTGMTASASQLAAGAAPTVVKSTNDDGTYNFEFGIPKGATGDTGATGNGISSFTLISGTHAAGTTDTYRLSMTSGDTVDVHVYNGADGDGAGDMLTSTYDPDGKAQDVFAYADNAVSAHNSSETAHSDLFAGKANASHASTHATGGSDEIAPSDIGAASKAKMVTVTVPYSAWTLSNSCYKQSVAVSGLLTTDTDATVRIEPVGSTDAAAQLLTDAAYASIFTAGGYAACVTAGYLYIRGPSGGSAPTVNFSIYVIMQR